MNRATRRRFVATAIMLLVMPLSSVAQRSQGVPRVGFLSLQSFKTDSRLPAFITGMREFGYVEGQTVVIEWRSADGNPATLARHADELVRLKVDLIVAVQPQAIDAARRATSQIPIVFAIAQDPVASGYAKSLSRPGGHITGVSILSAEVSPKLVEFLKIAIPKLSRLAVLVNPTNTGSPAQLKAIEAAARKSNLSTRVHYAATRGDVEGAFAAASDQQARAVIVTGDSFFFELREPIAQFALSHRLPTMFVQSGHVLAGGLMSYGPNVSENYRRSAYYVHRILNGSKPSELPIEQPTKFEMLINLRTAKSLGIVIPKSIIQLADRLIE